VALLSEKESAMDTKQTKQLVMQAYQAYKDKNIKAILDLCADDIDWVSDESDYIPFAGHHHGKDQVAQFFNQLEQSQDGLQFEPQIFIAEGDKVAVSGISRWRVKATGQTYDNPWVHIFTVRDGKIARLEQHNHTAAAEAAYRPAQGAGQAKDTSLRH
jgi:ketosteroid isomerase-like protein